jgi:hypothetical protein
MTDENHKMTDEDHKITDQRDGQRRVGSTVNAGWKQDVRVGGAGVGAGSEGRAVGGCGVGWTGPLVDWSRWWTNWSIGDE